MKRGYLRLRLSIFFLCFLVLTPIAFGGRKSAKLAENIDLPSSFDVDFILASKQRADIAKSAGPVPDD